MEAAPRECRFTDVEWEAIQRMVTQLRRFKRGHLDVRWDTQSQRLTIAIRRVNMEEITGNYRT